MSLEKIVYELPNIGNVVNIAQLVGGCITCQEALKYKVHRCTMAGIAATAFIDGPLTLAAATLGLEIAANAKEDIDAWIMSLSDNQATAILVYLNISPLTMTL